MAELLIVDNDARISELVAWFLERKGHRVRRAASFAAARAAIAERAPELMLSDIDLGTEDGREELPALARAGLLPPTLVVSGYLDRELAARLAALPGVRGTLAKPFDLAQLEARVAAALAGAGAAPAAPAAPADGWVEILPPANARVR